MVLNRSQRTRARGFTLIELLVVLAIMGLLLSLAMPRYYQHVDAAKETVLRENLRLTRDSIQRFYGDLGRYPSSLDEMVERKYLLARPIDPITESANTWQLKPPPPGYAGAVYDLSSGAPGNSKAGDAFSSW